jgi:hypothetical protein
MIKVEVCKDKVCNSCIDTSAYKVEFKTNEHNGCEFYLCEDCMRRLSSQVGSIKLGEELERKLYDIHLTKMRARRF